MYKLIFNNAKLNDLSIKNVLEVGCGYGNHYQIWNSELSTNTSLRLTAIDINSDAVDKLNQPAVSILYPFVKEVRLCSAAKMPEEQFDAIMSVESAFHYPDRSVFFKDCYQRLRENGRLVITDIICDEKKWNQLWGIEMMILEMFKNKI